MEKWNNDITDGIIFARWTKCGYCHAVYPGVIEIAKTTEIFELVTDTDGWPNKYGVKLVPAIIVLKDGKVTDKIEGRLRSEEIKNFIEGHKND